MPKLIEVTQYITPDNQVYNLEALSRFGRFVVSQNGWGTPPIDYITQRGPFQDGATVKDFHLAPRVIQVLVRQNYCDRIAWWAGRSGLLDAIRPNRQTVATAANPGHLRRVLPDGSVRDIDVFIQEGPRFEPRQAGTWDEWSFQEVLRFIAHDPLVYDPTEVEADFDIPPAVDLELVFPITFPIDFGGGDIDVNLNVDYVGTWDSYPVIEITGPIDGPTVYNNTTGEFIALDTSIALGEIVTINLAYGAKTVIDGDGNNLIGVVTSDSDLATWHIAPPPLAAGPPAGRNVLRLTGRIPTAATTVQVRYFTRYFGI